jgi:hypothetical protein
VKTKRTTILIYMLSIGIALGCTNVFAPFHEMAHVAVAGSEGLDAKVTSWSHSQFTGFSPRTMVAGWKWELQWSLALALLFSLIGKPKRAPWLTGGFFLGYASPTWIRAFSSSDFNNDMAEMIQKALVDQAQFPSVWAQAHEGLMLRWALWGGIGITLISILVVRNTLERRAHGKESSKEARQETV